MDPNAAWADFIEAIHDGDNEAAAECLDNLREWRLKSGFAPLAGQKDASHFDSLLQLLLHSLD